MTFADAAEAWLLHGERNRNLKRSTVRDYARCSTPTSCRARRPPNSETRYGRAPFARRRCARSADAGQGVVRRPSLRPHDREAADGRARDLRPRASRGWIERNPARGASAPPVRYSRRLRLLCPRGGRCAGGAAASQQDAAIFLTAAMTGLRRGELVALRWRDIDFPGQAIRVRANYSLGELVTPKSGKVRSVPMVAEVAQAPRPPRPTRAFRRGRRSRVRRRRRAGTRTRARCAAATWPRRSAPGCGRSRFTRCATTSARWR